MFGLLVKGFVLISGVTFEVCVSLLRTTEFFQRIAILMCLFIFIGIWVDVYLIYAGGWMGIYGCISVDVGGYLMEM